MDILALLRYNESMEYKRIQIKLIHPILILLLIVSLILISLKNNSFATDAQISENTPTTEFEQNHNSIDIIQILSNNAHTIQRKEVFLKEHLIEYSTAYRENALLPKGERIILQEGKNGLEEVYVIRTFEDNVLISEDIISNRIIERSTTEVIELGSSEFLSKYNIHLGDLMYAKEGTILKESPDNTSTSLCTVSKYAEVKLLSFSEKWCQVEFEGKTGYIPVNSLTSAFVDPEAAYENRKNKILSKLNFNMRLNEPSGLILSDFKKLILNEPKDINKIFENNIEIFYFIEKKYNINGVFLLAVGIHESGWGTSLIAANKNNLFGFRCL